VVPSPAAPAFIGFVCVVAALVAIAYRSSLVTRQKDRRAGAIRAVLEKAAVPLDGIVGAIRESEELQGAIIATAGSTREMINVDKPVLFSLYYGILSRLERIRAVIRDLESTARHHESRSGMWDSLKSWVKGDISNAEYAKRARLQAAAEERKMLGLVAPAKALAPAVKDLVLF